MSESPQLRRIASGCEAVLPDTWLAQLESLHRLEGHAPAAAELTAPSGFLAGAGPIKT